MRAGLFSFFTQTLRLRTFQRLHSWNGRRYYCSPIRISPRVTDLSCLPESVLVLVYRTTSVPQMPPSLVLQGNCTSCSSARPCDLLWPINLNKSGLWVTSGGKYLTTTFNSPAFSSTAVVMAHGCAELHMTAETSWRTTTLEYARAATS